MSLENIYRYRLREAGGGDKYGACEVCGITPATVFHQVEERQYFSSLKQAPSWTHHRCSSLFGHKACLEAQRR